MAEQEEHSPNYLALLKRRKVTGFLATLGVFILTTATALLLPPVYRSTAIIQIEQQEIPQELVRSTITSFADQRVQMIGQRIQSTTNLEKIIKKFNLFPDELRRYGLEEAIEKTREAISLDMISADVMDPRSGRPVQANIAFSLSFEHEYPQIAQKVSSELVTLYLSENQRTRTKQATETASFLSEEADKQLARIKEFERQLAAFKENHVDELPELMSLNLQLMQRTEDRLLESGRRIAALEEKKIYLDSELSQLDPDTVVYDLRGRPVLGPKDRLRTMESELMVLSSRYTEIHPDIVKLKREVSELKEQMKWGDDPDIRNELKRVRAAHEQAREKYTESHPDVRMLKRMIDAVEEEVVQSAASNGEMAEAPTNPAYIQLKTQLEAVGEEIRSIKAERRELRAQLDEYEQRLVRTPQVEREYRSVTREYERVQKEYAVTRARLMEAQLAESLERDHKGERFSVIEPPRLPEWPAEPNRPAIFFLGLMLALGLGFAAVALAEAADDALYEVADTQKIMGTTISIPHITTDREQRKRRNLRIFGGVGALLFMAAALATIHFVYKPLGLLWLILLRDFGLS